MDINFICPNCNQQLSADETMAGNEISCPSCNIIINVPRESAAEEVYVDVPAASVPTTPRHRMSLSLPTGKPSSATIQKPTKPLEAAAKASIKVFIKTIRHHECITGGKDRFDEMVGEYLTSVSEDHLIGVHTIQYDRVDPETKQAMQDYGVVIIFRREA